MRQRLKMLCPTPLDAALGVGRVALELAGALQRCGAEVQLEELWWGVRSRSGLPGRVQAAHAGCRSGEWFECQAPYLAGLPRGGAPVVHRSTQPDLAYLLAEARAARLPARLRRVGDGLRVVAGWCRVDGFACLGSAERSWMERRAPWLRGRLQCYLHAPASALRPALHALARRRAAPAQGRTRWLWMGRWTAHKGTAALCAFLGERLARFPGETVTLAGTGRVPHLPGLPRERLRVLPSFPPGELVGLLEQHDAGLFTSDAEGWGLSLQEMLESGMPVFATGVGAAVDLQPWFPESLHPFPPVGEALRGTGGLPRAGYLEQFNWDAIARHYLGWLGELSGGAAPGFTTRSWK